MRCPHCGKDIDESTFPPPLSYCPYCGQNLSATEEATESMHFCPHCGKELPGRVNFCPYCGGEVARHITAPSHMLEDSQPAEYGAKPIIEVPPEQKKKKDKLYKQWIKFADLPPEAIPSTETPKEQPVRQERRDMPAGREKNVQGVPLLYMLIGLCTIALFVLIIILIMQSC